MSGWGGDTVLNPCRYVFPMYIRETPGLRPGFEARFFRETSVAPKVLPILLDSVWRVICLLISIKHLDEAGHSLALFRREWVQRRLCIFAEELFDEKAGCKEEIIGRLVINSFFVHRSRIVAVQGWGVAECGFYDFETLLESRENVEGDLRRSSISKH